MENLEEKAGGLEAGREIGVSISSSSAKLRSFLGVWCSGIFLGLAAAALVVLVDAEKETVAATVDKQAAVSVYR